MENIIDYVENNLNGMAKQPFGAVDSLVLSKLSYFRFNGIVPGPEKKRKPIRIADLLKAELFSAMLSDVPALEQNRRLLFALAASPRFRDIQMNCYAEKSDPVAEKQFSAVTFLLQDSTAYIAYRGTDATFIGWKEDVNMAFMSPVPSQAEGAAYLNAVARRLPRAYKIRTGGHSKGGNLAVYAAVKCDPAAQKRITGVYNHDGPGFKEGLLESPEFRKMADLIHTTLPESSLVGMLLEQYENYSVVKSSRTGIAQHEPYSWLIENGDFCYTENIKSGAAKRNKAISQWIGTLSDENRKLFTDLLYQILEATEAQAIGELSGDWLKSATAMLGALKNIDPDSRKFLSQTINGLVKLSIKNMYGSK
jgi:hypothetical protein